MTSTFLPRPPPSSPINRPAFKFPKTRKPHYNSVTCRSSSPFSSFRDFDLYDLLGIDGSSDHSQIKTAYRSLQKRCHPDIAGPAGHDMAILLNEVYSVLSDPSSRLAYDKEQGKMGEFQDYTGRPIYSSWFGSESEERAVFVDEVKCVGCLKCALFAEKTFAIESVYGRARVVAQWADPEHKIQEAIEVCPVDCISIIERGDLAAMEYLMSKQPRGNVRMNTGNAVGTRVSNIFVDIKKFQSRYNEAKDKASKQEEPDAQREARMAVIQAIRSISNGWYWQTTKARSGTVKNCQKIVISTKKPSDPNMKKLQDAASAWRQARKNGRPAHKTALNYMQHEEYWTPLQLALPTGATDQYSSGSNTDSDSSLTTGLKIKEEMNHVVLKKKGKNPIRWGIPLVTSTIASVLVHMQQGRMVDGGLKEHVGGSMALEIVNSSWLQVVLAGLTWCFIGVVMVELIEVGRRTYK